MQLRLWCKEHDCSGNLYFVFLFNLFIVYYLYYSGQLNWTQVVRLVVINYRYVLVNH
jgi:hypothetical protein